MSTPNNATDFLAGGLASCGTDPAATACSGTPGQGTSATCWQEVSARGQAHSAPPGTPRGDFNAPGEAPPHATFGDAALREHAAG